MNASTERSALADTAADVTSFASRRILLLSNVLRRASGLRYRRLLGLTQSEWGIVAELGVGAPRTLNALSAGIGLDKAQMSRAVASLVKHGFVLRRANPADAREILLRLSAKGMKARARLVDAGEAANEWLLRDVPPDERAALLSHLDSMMMRACEILEDEQKAER